MEAKTEANSRGLRKEIEGLVVSNKMDKSIVVSITTHKKDRRFKKYVKKTKKYAAHDEQNECAEGDTVIISQCRPLSKTKRWKLDKIIKKAV